MPLCNPKWQVTPVDLGTGEGATFSVHVGWWWKEDDNNFSMYFLLLAVLGLCCCMRTFSSYSVQVSHCGGFFCCRAWVCKLSSCSSQVQLPRGTWNLPRPRITPMSPALAGGFSNIGPPGKPQKMTNLIPTINSFLGGGLVWFLKEGFSMAYFSPLRPCLIVVWMVKGLQLFHSSHLSKWERGWFWGSWRVEWEWIPFFQAHQPPTSPSSGDRVCLSHEKPIPGDSNKNVLVKCPSSFPPGQVTQYGPIRTIIHLWSPSRDD